MRNASGEKCSLSVHRTMAGPTLDPDERGTRIGSLVVGFASQSLNVGMRRRDAALGRRGLQFDV